MRRWGLLWKFITVLLTVGESVHDQRKDEKSGFIICPQSKFDCGEEKNGYNRCISNEKVCNGKQDCSNNADEELCDEFCPPGFMLCNAGKCIPLHRTCDGIMDCPDGDDERKCKSNTVHCLYDQYRCQNDKCIPKTAICNGIKDCDYGEDEIGCPPNKEFGFCNETHFICDHTCNPIEWLCDGVIQCKDESDERMTCSEIQNCPENHFRCKDGECMNISKLCDDIMDCEDGSDESDFCHECNKISCPTECIETAMGSICKCDKDEWFDLNTGECKNINKCLDPEENICNHICVPVDSGFKCRCHDHFILDTDGFTCHAKRNPKSALFLATNQQIMKFTSYAFGARIKNSVFFENQRSAMKIVSIAYNPLLDRLYLALDGLNRENIGKIDVVIENKQYCVMENVNGINTIVVDWITNNFFYSGILGINVCDSDAFYCRRIYKTQGMIENLVVDPKLSLIYWVLVDKSREIMKANMDGSKIRVIGRGRALGVDTVSHQLYIFNPRHNLMQIYNPFLKSRKSITLKAINLILPMSDTIYWIDSTKNNLVASILRNIDESKIIYNSKEALRSITYNNTFFQDIGFQNPCSSLNCPYLCITRSFRILPVNTTEDTRTLKGKCICPDNFKYHRNGTCTPIKMKEKIIELNERTKMCASQMETCELEEICKNGRCKYNLNGYGRIEGIGCSCPHGWTGRYCENEFFVEEAFDVLDFVYISCIAIILTVICLSLYWFCFHKKGSVYMTLFYDEWPGEGNTAGHQKRSSQSQKRSSQFKKDVLTDSTKTSQEGRSISTVSEDSGEIMQSVSDEQTKEAPGVSGTHTIQDTTVVSSSVFM